jgi:hypothetical protein
MDFEERKDKKWIVENIPRELKALPIWVGFKFIPQKDKKPKKEPIDTATGRHAKSNDPKTWHTFDEVIAKAEALKFNAIGFAIIPPYIGIDIDGCVKDGVIASDAKKFIQLLDSYAEFSPTGTGVHIICKGELSKDRKFSALGVEMYSGSRFFTITGNIISGCNNTIEERKDELAKLFEESERFEEEHKKERTLLDRIGKSNDSEAFFKLYEGKWQDVYPSQSEADLAFCNKLAFWTGKNPALMDKIFRRSGLMRAKWDERHFGDGKTYGGSVIEKAVNDCSESFGESYQDALKRKPTQGEIITREYEEKIKHYFRDQQGSPFVVLPFGDHVEVCPTISAHFRNWGAKEYRHKFGVPPNNEALKQARIQIEARCQDAPQMELFNRVGVYNGDFYYDLTTHDWRGVRITKNGWMVCYLPPIFRRYQHQAEQVIPVAGGNPRDFLKFCNIHKDDQCLFLVSVASFFIPNIPHVIPNQNGEQGTGKSNNSRRIKGLVDPSKVMLISTPKDLEHAQMTADKHWINTFDNISKIQEWFSDFLCRAVTGEGDMKRSLYTNDEEFIRAYRRCFVLNGIGASMWRPDLLDRSIIFDIPLLKETRSEKEMTEQWNASLPFILGGFFTALSNAMVIVHQVKGHEKFRMADFAQWGAVLAEALGYSRDEFFKKYQESVDRKWQDTAEDSALAKKLINIVLEKNGEWHGSAAELLSIINPDKEEKGVPANAKWLSTELTRIAPVMRNVGIDITRRNKREAGTGRRIFILKKMPGAVLDEDYYGCEDGCEQDVSRDDFCEQEDDTRPF